jgi:anti-sigma B factor antagonist
MGQEITVTKEHVLVKLSGKICAEEAAQLRESLIAYIVDGQPNFVLDFGDVDYIDSAGLGSLVAIQKRALQNDGSIVIKNLKGIVKDLFELTRLVMIFEIQ